MLHYTSAGGDKRFAATRKKHIELYDLCSQAVKALPEGDDGYVEWPMSPKNVANGFADLPEAAREACLKLFKLWSAFFCDVHARELATAPPGGDPEDC